MISRIVHFGKASIIGDGWQISTKCIDDLGVCPYLIVTTVLQLQVDEEEKVCDCHRVEGLFPY